MKRTIHVRPPAEAPLLELAELQRALPLVALFVRRGIAVRYGQMALGVIWSLLEPLGLLVITTTVFGFLIRVPTGDHPYIVFLFSALIPWLYFNRVTTGAAHTLQEHIGIVSKVYFPRIILPISAAIRELFDSLMLFLILIALAWIQGYPPTWRIALMPVLLALLSVPALGVGMSVCSTSIKFRDIRPLLQLFLQAGFYATPVFYPASLVPQWALPIYQLNPIYWAVELSRWIMLDQPVVITPSFYWSLVLSAGLVWIGFILFARYERSAVDDQ